ncbi:MAG TPA: class I SAM-dependent methyltransferase, partial [Spirochaetes bacterium]|nr:class I SAM-dependent methyltransferase [Spirochaetota bacterium]
PSPSDFLKEVYRILKPGGYIIVTTPNVEGLFAKIFRKNWRSVRTDHLFLFSRKNLRDLLEQCGFNVLKYRSWGGIPVEMSSGKIKQITDYWVKYFNVGDVMLFLAQK